MQQRPQQQQQQLRRASQPSTAANGRRPVHSSPGVAVRQPLQALRPRTYGNGKLRCRAGQHAKDSVVTADRQVDEGAKNPTISPPRGIVANNAVALWRRRRQQGREPEDKNSSSAAASAAEAAEEIAKPGVDAGVDSVTVQQAQHPAAAQPQADPSVDEAPGSVLGAVALITGSTVGAGILALPSVAAPAGFGPSTGELPPCFSFTHRVHSQTCRRPARHRARCACQVSPTVLLFGESTVVEEPAAEFAMLLHLQRRWAPAGCCWPRRRCCWPRSTSASQPSGCDSDHKCCAPQRSALTGCDSASWQVIIAPPQIAHSRC